MNLQVTMFLSLFATAMYLQPVFAESVETDPSTDPEGDSPATAQDNRHDAVQTEDPIEKKMREMESALEEQHKETQHLKAQSAAQQQKTEALEAELANLKDAVELDSVESEDAGAMQRFAIFGFFDLTYYKGFYDASSLYQMYLPSAGTFTVTNLNVYLQSQMTETLSAIAELRFSFLPLGFERQYEAESHFSDGTTASDGREYIRTDTTIRDPLTTGDFQQGGVTIERVHLTYTPFDWFGVIAGRYLTPYGIWNIDHGSPVVIPARIPNMQYRAIMPLSQTGFMIFGRFFPSEHINLDYALTLSNGRGPIESVLDLDENKGIGFRLKFTYTGKNVTFFIGSYGYTGEYTDIKKRSVIQLQDDLTIDEDQPDAFITKVIPVEAYREYVVSGDMLISLFHLTLQSEVVWRRVHYSIRPYMDQGTAILNGGVAVEDTYYMPDFVGYGVYTLLSYELPLPELKWMLKVTPYVMYERGDHMGVYELAKVHILYAGLNVKPSPYITLKGEFMRSYPDAAQLETTNAMTLQLAVSF